MRANVVSRVLGGAGFAKGETHTTSIHGWYSFTTGYVCSQHDDKVRVERQKGDWEQRNPDRERVAELVNQDLDAYATYLRSCGYTVDMVMGPRIGHLIVSKES